MYSALVLGDVVLRLHDACLTLVTLLASHPQLVIHGRRSIDECGSLALQNLDAGLLSEALLLPLGKSAIVLVDSGLLPRANLLLFIAAHLERFTLPLDRLVLRDGRLNVLVQFADLDIPLADLCLDTLALLGDLNALLGLLVVHSLECVKLITKTCNDGLLAVKLRLEILLKGSNRHFKCLFAAP